MPRQARLDAPGALHHIIVRGINKAPIFKDDQDKNRFLERLAENVTQGQCKVYAWVLMTNHIHVLFKSGKDGISSVMRRQLTWYEKHSTSTVAIKEPAIFSRTAINRSSAKKKHTFSPSFAIFISTPSGRRSSRPWESWTDILGPVIEL
jgi:REP element-mobilizing transposase RayT